MQDDAAPEAGLGGWSNPRRFAGREYDAETGLYSNRARYYDPSLGRFLSPDPTGLSGGINGYAYAANDPVNHADPSGQCTWTIRWNTMGGGPPYNVTFTSDCQDDGDDGGDGSDSGSPGSGSPGAGPGPGGPAGPAQPPKPSFRHVHEVPKGSLFCTGPNGHKFYAPPSFNLRPIIAAGEQGGRNPLAMAAAVGQYGSYDFQRRRDPDKGTTFFHAYWMFHNRRT